MAGVRDRAAVGLSLLLLLVMSAALAPVAEGRGGSSGPSFPRGLNPNFYKRSCPQYYSIVQTSIERWMALDVQNAAHLLRLLFHDAVVNGVDASIMIDSTPTNSGERDALPNRSLLGFNIVDDIKQQLEAACPGTVSCADILVTSVRDAIVKRGAPFYPTYLGRRDGLISAVGPATTNNPSPNLFVDGVLASFAGIGLGTPDAVALSGAHTIGKGVCGALRRRLTNFNGTGQADPTIPADYLQELLAECADLSFRADMDPLSPTVFDNKYYVNLLNSKGFFVSDQYLVFDPRTKPFVTKFAFSQRAFFAQFRSSIFKLSNVGVLTGAQGEIRTNCHVVNSAASSSAPTPAPAPAR